MNANIHELMLHKEVYAVVGGCVIEVLIFKHARLEWERLVLTNEANQRAIEQN